MLEQLAPSKGTVTLHAQMRVGTFAQNQVEELVQEQGDISALACLKKAFPEGRIHLLMCLNVRTDWRGTGCF